MFKSILKSRFGLVSSLAIVGVLATAMFLVPQSTNTHTSAENCVNPPVTPTLNHWPVTYDDANTPLCHDFPAIDAAKYDPAVASQFSKSEADWQNGVQLGVGEQGVALMYIHNGAANNLGAATTAKDVKVTTVTDTTVGAQHQIKVTYAGSNTNTVTKTFTVHTPANAQLEVIPNSGQMYDYLGNMIPGKQNLNLGNSTYDLGDLQACFEYSLFLSFKFKVVAPPAPTPGKLSISKTVKNDTTGAPYADLVQARTGDRVTYKVTVTNIGASPVTNVKMTDTLPAGLTPEGNVYLDGANTGTAVGSTVLSTLGTLAVGQTRTIEFTTQAVATGPVTIKNTACAIGDAVTQVCDDASVDVIVVTKPGPGVLAIAKTVKNDTVGGSFAELVQARTGENATFRVVVTNTGATAITNVKMTDVLPAGVTPVGNIYVDGVTTTTAVSANLNVSLGTLAPGQSRTIEFTTKVVANGPATIKNTACAIGDAMTQVCDDASIQVIVVNQPGTPNIVLNKKAFNHNKNVDATTVPADRGNVITFTLTTTNTGTGDALNYVITDDLSKVLPLADLLEATGGTLNGNVLTYPAMTIKAGETVTKTIKVRVKDNLASTLSFQIMNTYGNTVTINVPGREVFEAPKTGAGATSAGVFAGLVTVGFIAFRKREELMKFIAA